MGHDPRGPGLKKGQIPMCSIEPSHAFIFDTVKVICDIHVHHAPSCSIVTVYRFIKLLFI